MKNIPIATFWIATMRIGADRITVTRPVATDADRSRQRALSDGRRAGAETGMRRIAIVPRISTSACTAMTGAGPTRSVCPTMTNAINIALNWIIVARTTVC